MRKPEIFCLAHGRLRQTRSGETSVHTEFDITRDLLEAVQHINWSSPSDSVSILWKDYLHRSSLVYVPYLGFEKKKEKKRKEKHYSNRRNRLYRQ